MDIKETVKNFWSKHKLKIVAGFATVGATAFGVWKAFSNKENTSGYDEPFIPDEELDLIDLSDLHGSEMTDFWKKNGCINTIIRDVNLSDIGNLGAKLASLDLLDESQKMYVVLSFDEKKSE